MHRRIGTRVARSLIAALYCMIPAMAHADSVSLYAAGSLRDALNDVARAFEASSGNKVTAKYGPSGLLKDEIAAGAAADVFASANMEHPQALAQAGKSGPVMLFTRNRLCALVRPGLKVTSGTLADKMLDPGVKLGTSTPKADPSGDYAWEVFHKIDATKPGAFATLEAKALKLMGGTMAPSPTAGRVLYGTFITEGKADIFLTYCTGAIAAQAENPGQQVVQLPEAFVVGADYGLTVMKSAGAAAQAFAKFIMAPDGQRILMKYGFAAGDAVK